MAAQLIKEIKTWRVDSEEEAVSLLEEEKASATGTVEKSGYVIKTKKSKGEIVDMWAVATLQISYEV